MKKTGNKTYLLDTNIVINLLKGQKKIADEISKAQAIYLPVPALGELYFGAENSIRKEYHIKQINSFLKIGILLNTGVRTALIYGKIKAYLTRIMH